MSKENIIIKFLKEELSDNRVIEAYNNFAEAMNYEERIHDNEESNINEMFDSAWAAMRAALYGEYRVEDDYYYIDGNANLCSFDSPASTASPIDFELLAEWLAESDQSKLLGELGISLGDELYPTEYVNDCDKDQLLEILSHIDDDILLQAIEDALPSDSDVFVDIDAGIIFKP